MRTLRLLSVAAQAEGLRLRREGQGLARRVVIQAVAAVFLLIALAMLHIAGFQALMPLYGAAWAACIVGGVDLALGGILLLLARPRHDPVAQEALLLRQTMMQALANNATGGLASMFRAPMAAIGGAVAEALLSRLRRR